MKIAIGNIEYNTDSCDVYYRFWDLENEIYDPNYSPLRQPGEHYTIYRFRGNAYPRYLLYSKIIRGNDIVQELIAPIPDDVALLLSKQDELKKGVTQDSKQRESTKQCDVVQSLSCARKEIENHGDMFRTSMVDLCRDIDELQSCFLCGAYRAVLAMSGRILEMVLKSYLTDKGVPINDDWMVGRLLQEISRLDKYTDPSLKNVWNIINLQRIVGVHVKEQVPIPSKENVYMVLYAVIDTINRLASDSDFIAK